MHSQSAGEPLSGVAQMYVLIQVVELLFRDMRRYLKMYRAIHGQQWICIGRPGLNSAGIVDPRCAVAINAPPVVYKRWALSVALRMQALCCQVERNSTRDHVFCRGQGSLISWAAPYPPPITFRPHRCTPRWMQPSVQEFPETSGHDFKKTPLAGSFR